MILLDTNVISELMRPAPDPRILAWIENPNLPETGTTAISLAEIAYGIALLPEGRRRQAMQAAAERFFNRLHARATLPFDSTAAAIYGELAADHRRSGWTVGILDLQIAAIARARDSALATRNVRHFAHCGIEVIDPFAAGVRA